MDLSILDRFLVPLDDPGSRLFHLNLIIALVLVALWIAFVTPKGNRWTQFKKLVLRKKYWWNRSTKVDYQVYFLNALFKVFLFVPFLDFSFRIAVGTANLLEKILPDHSAWQPTFSVLLSFTVVAFVWDDFLRFFQHVLMHKIPWLWPIHAMHHSARVLTPVTLFRNHPLESAIATIRNSLSLGVATGAFVFLFESQFNLLTLFGVNALGFLFNLAGANLRHSHIPISFGPFLEKIFISPKQHQIHHSRAPEHMNKNFGVSLSLWDFLFGSLVYSHSVKNIRVGIYGEGNRSLWRELLSYRR